MRWEKNDEEIFEFKKFDFVYNVKSSLILKFKINKK
jgi:hypothetical protein